MHECQRMSEDPDQKLLLFVDYSNFQHQLLLLSLNSSHFILLLVCLRVRILTNMRFLVFNWYHCKGYHRDHRSIHFQAA